MRMIEKILKQVSKRVRGSVSHWRKEVLHRGFYPCSFHTPKAVLRALKATEGLRGAYYEFGLYKGYTFYKASKVSSHINHYGFDSFEGLPDTDEGDRFKKGGYAESYEQVVGELRKRGVKKYKLFKGFYEDVLTKALQAELLPDPVRVALIDCDLYASTVPVLEFLTPLLQNDSIICFDDWNCFNADPNAGERRATSEWLARNRHIMLEDLGSFGWHGNSFRVHITT